jgi:uncharacterized membrane protein YdjX (TVP38/TMEM64 family)
MTTARTSTLARVGIVGAMLAAPLALTQVPTVRDAILSLAALMRSGAPLGVLLYVVYYVVGSLLAAPLWLLSGLAGFAWGPARGALFALPALALGSAAAFTAGRLLARTAVGAALRDHPRMRSIEMVVRREGRRIAWLLRLAPVMPQNLLHFALGATPLRLRDFTLTTLFGLLPATVVHAYAGSLLHDATEFFAGNTQSLRDPQSLVRLAVGVLLTVVIVVLVVRRARRALAQAVAEAERDEGA